MTKLISAVLVAGGGGGRSGSGGVLNHGVVQISPTYVRPTDRDTFTIFAGHQMSNIQFSL